MGDQFTGGGPAPPYIEGIAPPEKREDHTVAEPQPSADELSSTAILVDKMVIFHYLVWNVIDQELEHL